MTETPTPAQDLAALDRVAVIASEAGLMSSDLAVLLERLREPIVTQQKRHRALSAALAAEWKWDDSLSAEAERAVDRILAAIAVAGARIVWPSPPLSGEVPAQADEVAGVQGWMTADLWAALGRDPGEFDSYLDTVGFGEAWAALLGCVRHATRRKGPDAAPRTDSARATVRACPRTPGCALPAEHDGGCGIMVNAVLSPSCQREKVLAEVAAVDVSGIGPGIPVDDIVENAAKLALDRFEEGGLLHLSRVNVLHAAAMLLEAAGRMGGAR